MDWFHTSGVSIIAWLQATFKEYSSQMLFVTHLGSPGIAFLLYFPLAYFCNPIVGVQVLWVAAISEYANGVFKWFLYGERPYWWVHETTLYGERQPALEQFHLTCETGPGSPSGHAMVTAAVLHTMLTALIKHNFSKSNHRLLGTCLVWGAFVIFMSAVAISRCYISAHFPHQVFAGAITGVLVSLACGGLPKEKLRIGHYISTTVILLTSAVGIYWCMTAVGLDPLWSFRFAKKWCVRSDWVHLNTTIFSALIRDASSILGLGVGLHLTNYKDVSKKQETPHGQPLNYTFMGLALALLLTQASSYLKIPQDPAMLFYVLSAIKHTLLPAVIVAVIPKICKGLLANSSIEDEERKKVS